VQFARQSEHGDRRRAGLGHPLHGGFVRDPADTADRIGDDVHLVAFTQRVERREGDADLGPQTRDDQFLAPGSIHGRSELGVFP
jgi:hypothetical protein